MVVVGEERRRSKVTGGAEDNDDMCVEIKSEHFFKNYVNVQVRNTVSIES